MKHMQKILAVLLAVCLIAGISACGGSGGDDQPAHHGHKCQFPALRIP